MYHPDPTEVSQGSEGGGTRRRRVFGFLQLTDMKETAVAAPAKISSANRLDTLDGMRGVAALLVVIYHLFARWAVPEHTETLYPHGNALEWLPAMAYLGQVGVLLFFLISGFLMLMTLERSTGLADFGARRIARLWPSMLVCATLSAVIINWSGVIGHYGLPDWEVTWLEYLSSIFFVNPSLVAQAVGGPDSQFVEGVYWTLWAEVRFYALIALVFLVSPRHWFLWAWIAVQAISTTVEVLMHLGYEGGPVMTLLWLAFQPRYLGWFSLGICGYLWWGGRGSRSLFVLAALALAAILVEEVVTLSAAGLAPTANALPLLLTYVFVSLPFLMFLRRSPILNVFRFKPMIAVGMASYPLYLFHERPGMAALMVTDAAGLPPAVGVALVIGLLVAAALVIHHVVEMPAKRGMTAFFKPGAQRIEARMPWLRFAKVDR